MRKFSLFLLLASSAMPAMAQRGDDKDRQSRRASQSDQSEDRVQRAERPPRAERMERVERIERREAREQQPQVQVERQVQSEGARSERIERYQQRIEQQQDEGSRGERLQRYQQQQVQEGGRNERLERYRERRLEAGQQTEGGALAPRQRRIRTIPTTTPQIGQSGPVRTDVHIDHRRYDRDRRHRWSNHWRTDHRYDWRRHRDRNRFTFRIGFYSDPFGYGYHRFGLGSYLYPSYYQSNYWINDPWQYRLPPAYGPYRWVRYHSDALLIDIYSGEVVDVIHGFFW